MKLYVDYQPYDYQEKFEEAMDTKRRAVLCWARRHGKDLACWNFLILKALQEKGIYYYIFPEYSQARKALWEAITETGINYLSYVPKEVIARKLSHEMKLHLINGSLIQCVGSDNYDSIRGTNPRGVVLSEYAYQTPLIWNLVLDPILSKNKGWAVFNSTPNGKNHFFDLFNYASAHPEEYYVSKITNEDTHFITDEELTKKKARGVSEEFIAQEYYCSFDIGVQGSYYGRPVRAAQLDGRICKVPYDKNYLVNTVWDLGYSDSTSIIFYQKVGAEIHIIDCYENHAYNLVHYIDILRSKPYSYGSHFVPHDAKRHDYTGNTFTAVAADLNFNITLLPRQASLLEGIEQTRGGFVNMYFDKEKCDYLLRCLLQYHAKYDDKANVYSKVPDHDWSSHMCFIGETLISTNKGNKRIDSLKIGDRVLTPNGYKKILNVFEPMTKELVKVKTTNSSFTCTPEHKVFTERGLLYADTLRYNDILFNEAGIQQWKKKHGLNSKTQALGFRDTFLSATMKSKLSLMAIGTDGMETIIDEGKPPLTNIVHYKGRCGQNIKERFQRVFMFIIRMVIRKIVELKIWNVFRPKNTLGSIKHQSEENSQEKTSIKLWNMRKFGMQAQKASNGIKNMLERVGLENLVFQQFVLCAERNIKQKYIIRNFVQTNVKPKPDICHMSMMKQELAPFVEKDLAVTNIRKEEHVQELVPLKLREEQKVFDIEVEDDHCYFANNILVSNSDAFRYLVQSLGYIGGSLSKAKLDEMKRANEYYL